MLVAHAAVGCNSGDGGAAGAFAETAAINTTGATLLIAFATNFGSGPSITDNKGNIWDRIGGQSWHPVKISGWKAREPINVGAGHTFRQTCALPSGYPAISVSAHSGVDTTVQAVTSGGAWYLVPSATIGPLTPITDGALVIACLAHGSTGGATVDAAYTLMHNVSQVGGNNKGIAQGYQIQGVAAPTSATWTLTPSSAVAGMLVVFAATESPPVIISPPDAGGSFPFTDIQAGRIGPLIKIRVYNPALAQEYVSSTQWIQDPIAYWGGFAEASLLRIDDIVYAASDRSGPLQVTAMTFEMSDVAHDDLSTPRLRTWLGQVGPRALRRCEIWAQMTTDTLRRALQTPVTVFRGYIEEYEGLDQFRMSVRCLGWIQRVKDRPILPHFIGDLFPFALPTTREQRLPLAIGLLTDEGSDAAAPVFVEDEAGRAESGIDYVNAPVNSFGDIVGVPAPTGLSLSEDLGGGSLVLTTPDFPDNSAWQDKWAVQVTRVRGGVESDPTPFVPNDEFIVITADNSAIDAVCSTSGHVAGDVYRFYLGTQPVGGGRPTFEHYIQTSTPATGVKFTERVLTPGGVRATNTRYWSAAVWIDSDGRTSPAIISASNIPIPFILSPGYLRPVRFAFTPPPVGVTSGEVYISTLPSADSFFKKFAIDITNVNGNGDVVWEWNMTDIGADVVGIPQPEGVVPPVHAGKYTDLGGFSDWDLFIVSGRPGTFLSAYIGGIRIDDGQYGVDILAPGMPGWSTLVAATNDYLAVGAFRVFAVMLRGPLRDAALGIAEEGNPYVEEGEVGAEFRVNCGGIEDAGDGTGATITNGYESIQVVLNQLGLPEDPSMAQPFDQEPQFSDGTPKVNSTSFLEAEADAAVVVPAGPSMARWIANEITVQDLIADWAISARARVYTDESGQFGACVTNPDGAHVYDIVEAEEVIDRSFKFKDSIQGYGQIVPFRYNPRYQSTGEFELVNADEVSSAAAIAEADEELSLSNQDLLWRQGLGAARQVAKSILREAERLPRDVYADSALHWLTAAPLGKRVSISHSQGPQAGGWSRHLVQVLGKRLHPTRYTVALTCLDLRGGAMSEDGEDVVPPAGGISLPWRQYEEFMATTPIGGSRFDSCVLVSGIIVMFNYLTFDIDWDALPLTHGMRCRIEVAVEAGSVIPAVYEYPDDTGDVAVVEGSSHATSTLTEQTLIIPRPGLNGRVRYWALPKATGATADQIKMFGVVEGYEL